MKKICCFTAVVLVVSSITLSHYPQQGADWLGEGLYTGLAVSGALAGLARMLAGVWAAFDFNTRSFGSRCEQVYWRKKVFGNYFIPLHFGDLEYLHHFHWAGRSSQPA